jgi:hypothetical protein
MSRSSLWVMDKDYKGYEAIEFGNSWLFSPIVWGVLLDKYMHQEIQTSYGYKKSLIMNGDELNVPLNQKVNNCKSTPDRVCWELSNQQVFFTKDKQTVAIAIREFAEQNANYDRNSNGVFPLKQEHIIERFKIIADEILKLDETETPYFIFKNTSCDDGVEYWFSKYNEQEGEYEVSSLIDVEKRVTEFVFIENGEITGFKSNTEYFA